MQDNPPAFPCEEQRNTSSDPLATPRTICHFGMSLRDYFAGQTIPALIALSAEDKLIKSVGETMGQYVARSAYEMADAMLAERSRPDAG